LASDQDDLVGEIAKIPEKLEDRFDFKRRLRQSEQSLVAP
jgi:hypothetical protein